MKSSIFQAQVTLLKAAYTDYAILSSKYGVLRPTDIIEPYDLAMNVGAHTSPTKIMTTEMIKEWIQKVISFDWSYYDVIHFHISLPYWKHIQNYNLGTLVKQQPNIGMGFTKYNEAYNHYKNTGILDLDIISNYTRGKSNSPEVKRTYYHPEHGEVFGYARDVIKKFPNLGLNETNLTKIEKYNLDGTKNRLYCKSSKGWKVRNEISSS